MKRTAIKQKTYEEKVAYLKEKQKEKKLKPKVSKVKKSTKTKVAPISKLKKDLWEECKRIIRKRYVDQNGNWHCFTCGRIIDSPVKAQTGHFIPSSTCGAYLRYDLRNLRVQDYYCNINLGGNGSAYYKNLVDTEGQDYVDQLFIDKQKTIKADSYWYLSKIEEYKKL